MSDEKMVQRHCVEGYPCQACDRQRGDLDVLRAKLIAAESARDAAEARCADLDLQARALHEACVVAVNQRDEAQAEVAQLKDVWLLCDQTIQCAVCLWVHWDSGPHPETCPIGRMEGRYKKAEAQLAALDTEAQALPSAGEFARQMFLASHNDASDAPDLNKLVAHRDLIHARRAQVRTEGMRKALARSHSELVDTFTGCIHTRGDPCGAYIFEGCLIEHGEDDPKSECRACNCEWCADVRGTLKANEAALANEPADVLSEVTKTLREGRFVLANGFDVTARAHFEKALALLGATP